jgi:NadR type nicotinamide-nucleotide adenylyltransferase
MSVAGRPLRIVLIGPECTGKTWLARELARRYHVPWSEEYARLFVEAHPRPVVFEDVDAIGRGQMGLEDDAATQARLSGARMVIHDTDLVSTVVYSLHYYGGCPAWIEPAARARRGDLYLLHRADVPWASDGYQRAEPERRAELFERFRAMLTTLGVAFAPIAGDWDSRQRAAVEAIVGLVGRQ